MLPSGRMRRRLSQGAVRGKGMALSLRHGSFGGGQTDAHGGRGCKRHRSPMRHNAPDLGQGIFNLISVITARALDIPAGTGVGRLAGHFACGSHSWGSIPNGPRFNWERRCTTPVKT